MENVDYAIYIKDLEKKIKPYVLKRVECEFILLLNSCYQQSDKKFDDKHLEEDEEARPPTQDKYVTCNNIKPNPLNQIVKED